MEVGWGDGAGLTSSANLDNGRAGSTGLAIDVDGAVWTFLSLVYQFSFHSPSLWETAV